MIKMKVESILSVAHEEMAKMISDSASEIFSATEMYFLIIL